MFSRTVRAHVLLTVMLGGDGLAPSLCRAPKPGHGTGLWKGLELPPPADACLCAVTPTAGTNTCTRPRQ